MPQTAKVIPLSSSSVGSGFHDDGYHWPINEIVMQSHVFDGETDADIARTYHVPREEVTALRQDYGL